ncbi:MAG: murein hydrolase activator EnvC [Calditrichaceae bacterium]
MNCKSLLYILLFISPSIISAQNNYDRELSANKSKLVNIKQEIQNLRNQISKSKIEESSISTQIQLIDKEVALISQAKGLLETQRRIIDNQIAATNRQIKSTRKQLEESKKLFAERMVYFYKYGKIRNIELILTSASFNQALIRYRYLKLIAEQDERTLASIERKKRQIENLKARMNEDLEHMKLTIKAKEKEESQYLSRKSEKAAFLKKIRWNQSLYQKQLDTKEQERQQLNSFILTLERQRRLKENNKTADDIPEMDFDDFGKAKGRLPWPVKGKILTKYGKQRDPYLKTYVNNTGIEIESSLGTPVRCVFTGVVRMITYMSGYGNTVIIDHGNGYYTVYSHLDEIYVEKGDILQTGQTLATVGDSGSLSGTKLHFEIYGKQITYNPESWLQ